MILIFSEIPEPKEFPEAPNEYPLNPEPLEPEYPGSPEPEPSQAPEPNNSLGRYNHCNRVSEGILPITEEQIYVVESYLALKFQKVYGIQKVVFYDTTPEEDDVDSSFFFTNMPFPDSKNLGPTTHYQSVKR